MCDGQFHNCVCRSIDGKPLTWLTWQKDLWRECLQTTKQDLLNVIESIAYVSEEALEKLQRIKCQEKDLIFNYENLNVTIHCQNSNKSIFIASNGGPLDNYETLFWNNIYTTK